MNRKDVTDRIEKEVTTADQARRAGNEGMRRVCARRAAGAAISWWLEQHPQYRWGTDALGQLRQVESLGSLPEPARDAARRLTAKVTKRFTSPFPTDPIDDARILIDYFLR